MDTIFLTFANQQDNPLPNLQEEEQAISRLLSPREQQQHFLVHRDSFVALEQLPFYITLYRDDLVLFGFSGHAGRDKLLLTDGNAHAEGLAQLLAQCKRLKLVMLNGCSTGGQVSRLLDAGIPVVIATSAPVSDEKAAYFSTRFFEALVQQLTLRDAFEMAKGAVDLKYKNISWQNNRDINIGDAAAEDEKAQEEGVWGLFNLPKSEHILDWKLPVQTFTPTIIAQFTPNQHLIDTLTEALAPYNDEVQLWYKKIQRKENVPIAKKRIAVLNALPAPLAEPLRKLMVPVEDENEGYDKISAARLRQIVAAFNTAMELLAFTLLAQIWEAYDDLEGKLKMTPLQREGLRGFFKLSKKDREVFDFLALIRPTMNIFDQNEIPYFVTELDELRVLVHKDMAFEESLNFLNGLRLQVRNERLESTELAYMSKRGEECLTYLYSKLGFLARYKLAAIQGIDVQKFRHQRVPKFDHTTVMLHDLLGGFERSSMTIDAALDNRSILLINTDTWDYLNLSPFVLDENAYQDRTEICKVYFFSHYLPAADTWCYKYVYKPDDPFWEITSESNPLVKDQYEAFGNCILQQTLQAL